MNDNEGKRFNGEGPDLYKAMSNPAQADVAKPLILMYHRPERFDETVKYGIDLQLSGHTHAGQIPPMELIIRAVFKYPYGLYSKGQSFLYTTCGTGTWGPPMRLSSRSEIIKFVLEK